MNRSLWSIVLLLLLGFGAAAAHQYSVQYGDRKNNGNIGILEDLNSFSFTTDFGSVGGSGRLGFYTYTDDVKQNLPGGRTFGKGEGTIDLGAFQAGQHIGFYLKRNNGTILTDFYFIEKNGQLTLTFVKNGNGKDESLSFGSIDLVGAGGDTPAPSGQPLPGLLATLAFAGLGFGWLARRGRRTA